MPDGFKPRTPNLPPAGYQREEVLKRRQDTLNQQAEEQAATLEQGTIDPEVLRIERELIRQGMDASSITKGNPAYFYTWVNYQSYHGWAVKSKLAFPGWEVVTGDMPEAPESRQADGTRKWGDCLL